MRVWATHTTRSLLRRIRRTRMGDARDPLSGFVLSSSGRTAGCCCGLAPPRRAREESVRSRPRPLIFIVRSREVVVVLSRRRARPARARARRA